MRWIRGLTGITALMAKVRRQDLPGDSTQVVDSETGFTFASFTNDHGIVYNVAVPDPAPADGPYDLVFQTIVPKTMGWSGIAWGGTMTYNPLTIVWLNGNNVTVSSREAYGYYVPPAYNGSVLTVLPKGTHVNDTHYQVTLKCSGCSFWGDDSTGTTRLEPKGQNYVAFAYAAAPPVEPANNDSSFSIHDTLGHWVHDFSQGTNAAFNATVAKNS